MPLFKLAELICEGTKYFYFSLILAIQQKFSISLLNDMWPVEYNYMMDQEDKSH